MNIPVRPEVRSEIPIYDHIYSHGSNFVSLDKPSVLMD